MKYAQRRNFVFDVIYCFLKKLKRMDGALEMDFRGLDFLSCSVMNTLISAPNAAIAPRDGGCDID